MQRLLLLLFMTSTAVQLSGQQLYLEIFSGRNKTNYNLTPYDGRSWYFPLGAKVAVGTDHIQLGGEYSFNLDPSKFNVRDSLSNEIIGVHEFKSTYYGLFLRGKISRYPARRFGITILAGAGYLEVDRSSTVLNEPDALPYDNPLSYNAGIGVSLPTQGIGMLELGYSYYFSDLEATADLPAMKGSYH